MDSLAQMEPAKVGNKICLGLANVTSGQVEVLGKRITKKTANRIQGLPLKALGIYHT